MCPSPELEDERLRPTLQNSFPLLRRSHLETLMSLPFLFFSILKFLFIFILCALVFSLPGCVLRV